MKKIILFLSLIFLLTGCSATYEVTISKDSIIENVTISANNVEESNIIDEYLKPVEAYEDALPNSESLDKLEGVEYYNMNKTTGEYSSLHLSYSFPFDKYSKSNIINSNISLFTIAKMKNNHLKFTTGANYKAFDNYSNLDNIIVKVNINEPYEIVSSNADNKSSNTLIWYISKTQNNKKSIYMELKNKEEVDVDPTPITPDDNGNSNTNNNTEVVNPLIVVLVVLSFIVFIILIVLFKNKLFKRNN